MCLLQGKIWRWAVLSAPSVLSLGVTASEGVFLCLHLPDPVNLTPVGHQSQALKHCVLWLEATKAGVPDMCTSSFLGETQRHRPPWAG